MKTPEWFTEEIRLELLRRTKTNTYPPYHFPSFLCMFFRGMGINKHRPEFGEMLVAAEIRKGGDFLPNSDEWGERLCPFDMSLEESIRRANISRMRWLESLEDATEIRPFLDFYGTRPEDE